ncbi:hypothetical protein [Peribacillus simplex]|uniref:Apea-like HEPN domain-containing protein n=1 Tax=Peribacillus simplex TaxID=1478 RepID=A0A9W4KWH9_9BACI|nr:hypothetical protein [Peribacillus simplex]CAH0169128.1 hypothetical protein SRABI133_01139 [Peribacillus simplex]
MSNKDAQDFTYQYYSEELLENLNILKVNNEILVVEDYEINQKIALSWNNLFGSEEEDFDDINKFTFKRYNYEVDNPRMKYYPNKGFFIRGYGEFFIHYPPFDMEEGNLFEFSIGDVQITVKRPSNLFRFIFTNLTYDKYFGDFDSYFTISLVGVSKDKLEEILQQAMFIIGKYNPSSLGDYPTIMEFSGYDEMWDLIGSEEEPKDIKNEFSFSNYPEPIHFYNEGKSDNDPLNFYKVLEYFYIISRKDDLKALSDKLNEDGDIDYFTTEVTKIYRTDEFSMLHNLLRNLRDVPPIIKEAHNQLLISEESLEVFADKLYTYRNSIVHSKKDAGFNMAIPKYLSLENEYKWNVILEQLALLCIEKFCFEF